MASEIPVNSKPDTPPPAYSIHIPDPDAGSGPSSESTPPQSAHSNSPPPPFESRLNRPQHPQLPSFGAFAPPLAFGPTPLGQAEPTLGLLPYYDPRSPYAIAAAASRARWRFVGAAVWALGLLVVLLMVAAWSSVRVREGLAV
ncbi:hypothetical protein BV22DRAFT_44159 [Leucogyrophana mollusca]|uniref:Uncharacterized protein n=1 Tax=Leucogyrophana mollusca TaxID=85980 RepID=A0ACB8BYP5_9AGAM|nr:hypothetical protein BV22DRAFT_44159 [Leucogyrophana mollusca]